MSAPSVVVNKVSANAVQATQSGLGILAIIAPCLGSVSLPTNVPTPFSDTGVLQAAGVEGDLVEYGTYFINAPPNNSILAIRPTASTAGFDTNPAIPPIVILAATAATPSVLTSTAPHGLTTGDVVTVSGATGDTAINGTNPVTVIDATHFSLPVTGSGSYTASSGTATFNGIDFVGTGTAGPGISVTCTAAAGDYQVLVSVPTGGGGTVGTGPITLNVSLDGGLLFTPTPVALGSALSFTPTVPLTGASTGITITFTTATTLVAGDSFTFNVTGPRMTTSDLTAALAALRASQFEWDLVLVHGETSPTFVAIEDSWSTSLAPMGMFPFLLANTRHEYLPRPTQETDAAYQTSMSTLLSGTASINVAVSASAADMVSTVSGLTKPMPASLFIATRLEGAPIGQDPAYVAPGPVANANLYFPNGSAKWHDEFIEGGLDSQTIRLGTLRTFATTQGTYVTNSYVLSANGSNFVYSQQARVMNAGCAAVFAAMTLLLSAGYDRSAKTGLITPGQAAVWQARGQAVLDEALDGQVSGAVFTVSTQDKNLGNGPATITCNVNVEALGYVKKFSVSAQFVNVLA